jgi:predicted DNA-binding transcriptional regulator AlpA
MDEHIERLLTVADLAAWLNKPESWVYRHTAPGCPVEKRVPHLRLEDRSLRFRRRDIEAWLDKLSAPAGAPCGDARVAAPAGAGLDTAEDARSGPPAGATGPKQAPLGVSRHARNGYSSSFS